MNLPSLNQFLDQINARDPHQPEFRLAVKEVLNSLLPFIEQNPRYAQQGLLYRLIEPERVIQFRISWADDDGRVQTLPASSKWPTPCCNKEYADPSTLKPGYFG